MVVSVDEKEQRERERYEERIILNIRDCLHSLSFQHKGDDSVSDTSQLVPMSDYIVVFTL